jgi:hypothetical protein
MYRALTASPGRPLANSLQKEIEAFRKWPTKKMAILVFASVPGRKKKRERNKENDNRSASG